MSKNKKRKFLIVGTSTVLVASAFVPIVGAKSFKDVPASSSHFDSIDYLSEKGIISGYPGDIFRPAKDLSRSDVVKLMGKYLKSEGNTVPSNYSSKMRFKDLSANSEDELLQTAALAYDYGLFQGANGVLSPRNNITRQQMAVVLSRLIGKHYEVEPAALLSFATSLGYGGNVTDLNNALTDNRDDIQLLDALGITTVKNFNPRGNTTRGQFASFLYRTLTNNIVQQYKANEYVPIKNMVISPNGQSVTFTNVKPGTKITIKNQSGQTLGSGTADSSGNLTVTLSPALKAGDTINLTIETTTGEIITCLVEYPLPWTVVVPGNPDLSGLSTLIAQANDKKVAVSTDGANIDADKKWTTDAALATFEAAIASANTVANNPNSTKAQVDVAKTNLTNAIAAYESAQQFGKKANLQALRNLLTEAGSQRVAVSVNGSEVDTDKKWTTQAELTAFNAKIVEAQAVADKVNVPENEVAAAISELKAALMRYEAAKQSGTKADLSSLNSLLEASNTLLVKTSTTNGSEYESTELWTTVTEKATFEAAITAAKAVRDNTQSTAAQTEAARATLLVAYNTYRDLRKPGTQVALFARQTINQVALKTEETQTGVPVGGRNLNTAALSFEVLAVRLGTDIRGDILGIGDAARQIVVGPGQELGFTARVTISAVLGLGGVDVAVYKVLGSNEVELVEKLDFDYVTLLGMPMQDQYEFSFGGLTEGTYVLALGSSEGIRLNLVGGAAVVYTQSELKNRSETVNTNTTTKTTTGKVEFSTDAKIESVSPVGGTKVSNVSEAVPIVGQHGRLRINETTGEYSYTSFGRPASVGKVEVFEYEVKRGDKTKTEKIYIRHNAFMNNATVYLKWDDTMPEKSASYVNATNVSNSVRVSKGAAVTTDYVTLLKPDIPSSVTAYESTYFYVNGTDSVVTFIPASTLSNEIEYSVIDANNVTGGSVITPRKINVGALGNAAQTITNLPRGTYYISSKRSLMGAIHGMTDLTVANYDYNAANVTGSFFTTNPNTTLNNLAYIAPGSEVYINEQFLLGEVEILGEYGTLTVKRDGTYEYEPDNLNGDTSGKSEVFKVRVKALDGTEKEFNLTFNFTGSTAQVSPTYYSFGEPTFATTVTLDS